MHQAPIKARSFEEEMAVTRFAPPIVLVLLLVGALALLNLFYTISLTVGLFVAAAFGLIMAALIYRESAHGWFKNGFARLFGGKAEVQITPEGIELPRRAFSQEYGWEDVSALSVTFAEPETERLVELEMADGRGVYFSDDDALSGLRSVLEWGGSALQEAQKGAVRFNTETEEEKKIDFPL